MWRSSVLLTIEVCDRPRYRDSYMNSAGERALPVFDTSYPAIVAKPILSDSTTGSLTLLHYGSIGSTATVFFLDSGLGLLTAIVAIRSGTYNHGGGNNIPLIFTFQKSPCRKIAPRNDTRTDTYTEDVDLRQAFTFA